MATSCVTHSFATPGSPGYDTNAQIRHRFGIDGKEQPTLAIGAQARRDHPNHPRHRVVSERSASGPLLGSGAAVRDDEIRRDAEQEADPEHVEP
jgi:hypothetical protein